MTAEWLGFGAYRFDPGAGLLLRHGVPLGLGRRAVLLLTALLRRRGAVLGKAELVEAGWPGEVVEESNLSVQIAQLRRRLGPTPAGGTWIETVERVGYRFLPKAGEGARPHELPVLAVLRFAGADAGSQRFADGLVDELTTALAGFPSLAVVARSASLQYPPGVDVRAMARELGAGYVLEGTVARQGGGFSIKARLIAGGDGAQLWAHQVEAPHDNLHARWAARLAALVEPQVEAREVAEARRERPAGATVRDLYLRARHLLSASRWEGHAAAFRLLEQALQLEPENVPVLAAACEALHHSIVVGWPAITDDDRGLSLELAARGTYLGGRDGSALGLFSNTMFSARQHDMGGVTMERAVEVNRNSSMALVCAGVGNLFLGRLDAAEAFYESVLQLGPDDPNHKFAVAGLGTVARWRGQHELAIAWSTRALAINPFLTPIHWNLIASNAMLGRLDEARRHFRRYKSFAPGISVARVADRWPSADPQRMVPFLEALAVAGMPEA